MRSHKHSAHNYQHHSDLQESLQLNHPQGFGMLIGQIHKPHKDATIKYTANR